jgi:hypothetical protein
MKKSREFFTSMIWKNIGDWYLYQKHTEIRVYGCELPPYRLPKYLPIRIFALEYIRKMVNSDDIHFVSVKKKQQLRIKTQIGSFICNNRVAGEEVDNLLKQMNLTQSFTWNYDPFGVISELRVKQNSTPYAHVHKRQLKIFKSTERGIKLVTHQTFLKKEKHNPP